MERLQRGGQAHIYNRKWDLMHAVFFSQLPLAIQPQFARLARLEQRDSRVDSGIGNPAELLLNILRRPGYTCHLP